MGHVRDLPRSRMGIEIEQDFEPKYVIPAKSRKTVTYLKKLAKGKQAIFLAPDPDREGEAISWHLAEIFAGASDSIQRVEFNEITKDAVLAAFVHPRNINSNLVDAQQARRVLDRLVGYELSPLLWKKVGSGLSAGRVQSVALRLVVEREKEIEAFVPVEYWTLDAKLNSLREAIKDWVFTASLDKINNVKAVVSNQEQSEKIKGEVEKGTWITEKIEEKERMRRPQSPYTTSKLQQEAFSRLGFTAARTMQIAQHLYEGIPLSSQEGTVGLITYMRTDSVSISPVAISSIREFIQSEYGAEYLPEKPNFYKTKKGAQEAHEAIRPSSVDRTPEKLRAYLKPEELKLYELIWRKTVSSQIKPALDKVVTAWVRAAEIYIFKATGTRNVFPGFQIVYGKGEEEGVSLIPPIEKGEVLNLKELVHDQHFTKPPARYNDASLVKTLEEKGIGRPSTYVPTISTILARHYVNRKANAFVPTELGVLVVNLLLEHFSGVMDYDFTANMEKQLDEVEEGTLSWKKAIRDFYKPFNEAIELAREQMKDVKKVITETNYKCEDCGKTLVIRLGRFGKFMACSGFPACKKTRSLPTGFGCPEENCGGDLAERRARGGRIFFGCTHYPECRYLAPRLPKSADDVIPGIEKQPLVLLVPLILTEIAAEPKLEKEPSVEIEVKAENEPSPETESGSEPEAKSGDGA